MITPEKIKQKARRLYHGKFLKAFLSDESIFPLIIPADRGNTTEDFSKRYTDLDQLMSKEKSQTGYGYRVKLKEVNTRAQGRQSVPVKIFFETRLDFLKFLKKETEFDRVVKAVALIRKKLPELNPWIHQNPVKVIRSLNDWSDLITVCDYFIRHPKPNLYIRELPIDVHTKFIETHVGILKSMLDCLLPDTHINLEETKFEKRYGLKVKPSLIRFRILDPLVGKTIFHTGMADISLPVSQLNDIPIPCTKVFIVENEMNFLVFPNHADSIVIWGRGFAVENLRHLTWLKDKNIIYYSLALGTQYEVF